MPDAKSDPLLEKIIPAAEELIKTEHFSVENLCHAVDRSLRDVVAAIGSIDELILHVNFRFMGAYLEKAKNASDKAPNDLQAVKDISNAWLDHAMANPQGVHVLLQHKWDDGFERPDWYLKRVMECFVPAEKHLRALAPKASPDVVTGLARGLYAHTCGLYFLSTNERAKAAGILSLKKLLDLHVDITVKGLQS